jgi:enolase
MGGSENWSTFSASTTLGISFAVQKTGAAEQEFHLLSQNYESIGNSEVILLVAAFTITGHGSHAS